jgi:hypothetical protein
MEDSQNAVKRPVLVKLALGRMGNRRIALLSLWIALAAAIVAALAFHRFGLGFIFLVVAWWYWYAVRWTDNHNDWK